MADIFSEFLFVNISHSINNSTFPEQLKWADVKPVFKKNSRTGKENYRPARIYIHYIWFKTSLRHFVKMIYW